MYTRVVYLCCNCTISVFDYFGGFYFFILFFKKRVLPPLPQFDYIFLCYIILIYEKVYYLICYLYVALCMYYLAPYGEGLHKGIACCHIHLCKYHICLIKYDQIITIIKALNKCFFPDCP